MLKPKTLIKTIAIIFLLVFSLNALIAIPANAQLTDDDWRDKLDTSVEGAGGYQTDNPVGLGAMVGNIIKIVLGVLGIVLLIIIIYGGFLWMTSAGDEEKVSKAKKLIGNAIIGVLIVVLAYTITYFVIARLTSGITTGADVMGVE